MTAPTPIAPEPGPTTTEFWQTLLVNVLAVVVALAAVFGKKFDTSGLQPLVPAVALLASAVVTAWYSHSRATVKAAAHAATATVLAARAPLPPANGTQPAAVITVPELRS